MKIAFLIPSTTRGRKWRKMEDTYLYSIFGQSFLNTISEDIEYTIYINIDIDDPIYRHNKEKNKFELLIGEKAKIKWIDDGQVQRGFLTLMWNYLFEKALEDNNDYFYQCGDDIWFENKDWIKECITQMKKLTTDGHEINFKLVGCSHAVFLPGYRASGTPFSFLT